MTALELLTAAQARISDPAKWTQRAFARTATGRAVFAQHPDAACWCAVGALQVEDPSGDAYDSALDCLRDASRTAFDRNPASTNDALNHDAVMRVYADAMVLAEGCA